MRGKGWMVKVGRGRWDSEGREDGNVQWKGG